MEQLRRWREPVAVVLVVVAGIRLLTGIVAIPVLAGSDAYGSFAAAALFEASRTIDVALLLVTAGVAASCLLSPATPRARPLITVALVETAAAVLVAFGYGVMGLLSTSIGRGIEFVYLLLGLVVPVLAVVGLLAAWRSAPRPATSSTTSSEAMANEPGEPISDQTTGVRPTDQPVVPPSLPAAWQPEQATGRVWHTANDAARGAPGGDWPGVADAGWQPIPGTVDRPPSEQR